MECPQCGRNNRMNADYCAWCGSLLVPHQPDQPAAPDVEAHAAPPTATPEQPGNAEEPGAPPVSAEPEADGRSFPPLQPGAMLADRYEIIELLSSDPDSDDNVGGAEGSRTYQALDWATCPVCGLATNQSEPPEAPRFCNACGAAIDTAPTVTVVERLETLPPTFDDRFEEAGRHYFVTADQRQTADAPPQSSPLPVRLTWGRATDVGRMRSQNEDSLETWYYTSGSGADDASVLLGLFVVADGLGGHDTGEVASRLAIDSLWQSARASIWEPLVRGDTLSPQHIDQALQQAVADANHTVYNTRVDRANDMSTTLTLALVVGDTVYLANVGDSRAYIWNASGLRQVTVDHSLVQRLVDAGELSRQEVYTHPRRNVIYRSIGDQPQVDVDTFRHQLSIDDRVIVCSDGLWEMVHDDDLEEVLLAEPDPQRACDRLIVNANLAGGTDNITVIIVQAMGQ